MADVDTTRRKRFYKDVAIAELPAGGWKVLLDGRSIRTPAKRELAVPRRDLAETIAAEWKMQAEFIDPGQMHLTRLVNSTIDGVTGREAEVREAILAYGGSDLICYLADSPRELIERQSHGWGPLHSWLKRAFGVELMLASGVMPVEQDAAMLARLDGAMGERTPLELAALHVLTSTTGSLVLALAVLHRQQDIADAWRLAHIDEDFQIEKWGRDAEAEARRDKRWQEVSTAARVLIGPDR